MLADTACQHVLQRWLWQQPRGPQLCRGLSGVFLQWLTCPFGGDGPALHSAAAQRRQPPSPVVKKAAGSATSLGQSGHALQLWGTTKATCLS